MNLFKEKRMSLEIEEIQKSLQEFKILPSGALTDGYYVKWYNLSNAHTNMRFFQKN